MRSPRIVAAGLALVLAAVVLVTHPSGQTYTHAVGGGSGGGASLSTANSWTALQTFPNGTLVGSTAFITPACDNATDDTALIQAALNSGAKRVQVTKAGTCLVSGLTIAASVVLAGTSQIDTALKSSGTPATWISVTASNVGFQDITLIGTGATANAVSVATGLSGITFVRTTVRDAAGSNANCLSLISASTVLIESSTFSGCGHQQLYYTLGTGTTARGIVIRNSFFDASAMTTTAFDTVEISTPAGSTGGLTGVHITDSTFLFPNRGATESDGLVVISTLTNGGFRDVTITGNYIAGDTAASTTSQGMEIKGLTGFTISGNTVENSYVGIEPETGSSIIGNGAVTGNYVNCDVATRTCNIGILALTGKLTVSGNLVEGAFTYGVSIGNGNGVVVTGNNIAGHVGVQVNGGNAVVSDNQISGGGSDQGINIATAGAVNSMIRNNRISGTSYGILIAATSATNLILQGNTFTGVSSNYNSTNTSMVGVTVLDDPGAVRTLPIPTLTGCTATMGAGSRVEAGTYTSGTSGTCTVVLTPLQTAPTGWSCSAVDLTTPADIQGQTASTTTTATIAGTTVTGDVVRYLCARY